MAIRHVSLPDEQVEQLEDFKRMAKSFREFDDDSESISRTLEIRGTALVLAGILPPYITVESTLESIEAVLEHADSLLIKGH